MIRTLALSAMAAVGLMLMPSHVTPAAAAPTIAPKISTPDSSVELVRRGRGGFRGSYRGGRVSAFRGGSRFYRGGRHYRSSRHYAYPRYRHRYGRYYRRGVVIGAGLPFIYGGYSYARGCGYYYRKWQRTGSRYWRNRYYSCRW